MPSFSIPLTGLEADSTALNTIANNLANMNTTAYKAQTTTFSDLFYQQLGQSGSGNPIQVGAGTQVSSTTSNFTTGSVNATGQATDVALNGNGFFIVEGNGATEYTRAGNFSLSSNGFLTTQGGFNVMGYPAANGAVNTNAPLSAIQIPVGQVEAPRATASLTMTGNLDASAAAGAASALPAQVTLYDSLGVAHVATVTYQKTGGNTWSYNIALPAGEATGSSANASGTLSFDASGNLIAPAANVTGITFSGLADGANNLTFDWQLYNANGSGNLTQVASTSSIAKTTQDGYASGEYQSFAVNADGTVSAMYSNGQTLKIGQIAVATITNEQGLMRTGDGNYQATFASGQASVGLAGAGGRGTMQGAALEASNVDISTEFSKLIVAQRAFEANSKAITTFDTVTQQAINMIR